MYLISNIHQEKYVVKPMKLYISLLVRFYTLYPLRVTSDGPRRGGHYDDGRV